MPVIISLNPTGERDAGSQGTAAKSSPRNHEILRLSEFSGSLRPVYLDAKKKVPKALLL